MTKYILLILFSCSVIYGQAGMPDTLLNKWDPDGVLALNLSQISLSNWSQGGENAITWTAIGNFGYNFIGTNWTSLNNLKITYGRSKLGDEEFRVNDNELYLENVIVKKISWPVDPFFSNTVRTAISAGYKYEDSTKTKVADFFDPGYVTQAIGFTYMRSAAINTRLGIALQETFTKNFPQYSDDPETLDEIEDFKLETGLESVTNVSLTLDDDLLYKSLLRLFTRFDAMDVWDVRFDNTLTAQINKFINVNLNVLVIYEKSQTAKTQLKEALQLGIVYTLF